MTELPADKALAVPRTGLTSTGQPWTAAKARTAA